MVSSKFSVDYNENFSGCQKVQPCRERGRCGSWVARLLYIFNVWGFTRRRVVRLSFGCVFPII